MWKDFCEFWHGALSPWRVPDLAEPKKTSPKINPWHPMDDPVDLKTMGKLMEELGELQAVVARCVIQGIDEKEPVTGKENREWLLEEIADVYANLSLVRERFLNEDEDAFFIQKRWREKEERLRTWHGMA